jgi:hypothetical protein
VLFWSGALRSRYVGTVAVNTVVGRVDVIQAVSPLTFLLYFGAPKPNGDLLLQAFSDHRVLDGMILARVATDLEATLNRQIVDELNTLAQARSQPPYEGLTLAEIQKLTAGHSMPRSENH